MGARQLVVQEALETKSMLWCHRMSWLTPMTNMGVSSFEGAVMQDLLGPAVQVALHLFLRW